jgi:hypothetical protein
MSRQETMTALEAVSQQYPRLWMLRAYDTVTDPDGLIRQWLSENTLQFEDQVFAGTAHFRVQGYLTKYQPPPPQEVNFSFENRFRLAGFRPPNSQYSSGQPVDVALWLEVLADVSTESPYALSLKLWDNQGNMAAQADEWPVGSFYFSPAWSPGARIRHPMRLTLPADLKAGLYWLDVEIYRSDNGLPLSIEGTANRRGVTLGGIELITANSKP